MNEDFKYRIQRAFDFGTMADVARRLDLPHATVRNYFGGRLPAPEVLVKIANQTNVSLNWLLTGKGEMLLGVSPNLDLGRILEERINDLVDRRLAAREGVDAHDLGTVDEAPGFDLETAVTSYDDPQKVMSEWFRHEGREYPSDYGVVFFRGWETYSAKDKIEAVKDAKKVLDRSLKR
jgi:AcrR family transcriptional regulator